MLFFNVQLMLSTFFVLFNLNFIGNFIASENCQQAEYRVREECCPTGPDGKGLISELARAN